MTTQNSTQYAAQTAVPPTKTDAALMYGKARVYKINFAQAGVGSAGSIARLIKLPPGKVAVYGYLSWLRTSNMGSGRTLHIGYSQYRLKDGTIQTADPDALNASQAASAVAIFQLGAANTTAPGGTIVFESLAGVSLIATVNVGTIPDLATIEGVITVGVE
jgi:hypothetical protein